MGWVASYPLLSQAPTKVEVELGCDNISTIKPNKHNENAVYILIWEGGGFYLLRSVEVWFCPQDAPKQEMTLR